jgi:small-conductance mechanosensitive channel
MDELWNQFTSYLTVEKTVSALRAFFLFGVGLLVARLLGGVVHRVSSHRLEPQQSTLLRRLVFYGVLSLFVVTALNQLGFDLGVLLGAAGVLTVAIGFASQTSAANLVSGLFLIAERPFSVGDVIQVGTTTGEVLSIDLLSVKLRTFDNLYVRIPNETLIKNEVRTLTKFPIRRLDLQIGIAYKEDVDRVRKVLFDIADRNPVCLDEPKPVFIVQGFGDSAVQLQFSPWALRENYLELRNTIQREIKQAFDDQGIEIPFPQRVVRTAGPGDPFRGGGEAPLAADGRLDDGVLDDGVVEEGEPDGGKPEDGEHAPDERR